MTPLPVLFLYFYTVCVSAACPSQHYDSSGACCSQCPPGEGVTTPCSDGTGTGCTACVPGQTFSHSRSHTEPCRACSTCGSNMNVASLCNRTHDTVCECSVDFYWDEETERCERCQICPPGFGAVEACSSRQDSGCVACPNMTYSDVDSPRARCLACTRCTDSQVMLQTCTSISDTICLDKNMPQLIGANVRTTPSDGMLTLKDASGQNIIPVYCSIMGAVVVGLIVYVAVKRWKTCRRPQGSKSAPQPHDLEAQKSQNNDSGVCVEPCTTPSSGKIRVSELSSNRIRDLVFTLSLQHPVNWRHLAAELGYDIAAIDEFEQGNNNGPGAAKAFLVHWSRMENATVDNLCDALRAIGRQDVIELLQECNMGRQVV
ncbi:tumor necrosis factor receptor superfamily member 16-like [Branchiostoma lanceolatum]|uniref:tumor necrosis factor receptor superfamily member 16-like n=1 Tax=Branchiostoma lanceolatum TaxID=7740 RepID=UPI003451CC88